MKRLLFLALLALLSGCTEPYALQTDTFESALVVEATVTNEMKTQQIKITRTYRFEDNGPTIENDAQVTVTDGDGNVFPFVQVGDRYLSENQFAAVPGKIYRLSIVTADGKSYASDPETLTTVNPMDNVVPTVVIKDGVRGVQLNAQSFDPANNSKYYRYEYEETYKIVAPNWSTMTASLGPPSDEDPLHQTIVLSLNTEEGKVCYGFQQSVDIIQDTSVERAQDREDFTVRFIPASSAVIAQRYSILVRQYIQSLAAFDYYRTLKQIAGSGGILSPTQPGFFYGNLKCVDQPNEKVVGYFEVSSVSSKRIFFNYVDLFPGEPLPPYFVDCAPTHFNFCFVPIDPECNGEQLITMVNYNALLYFAGSNPEYTFVPPPCADCTTFASNIIPPYWE